MKQMIRDMKPSEYPLLKDFLLDAIYIGDGADETEWMIVRNL